MPNYFDCILEEAEYDNDPDLVCSEMDLALTEFDSYVQEGVGVKILIGVGVAAALAGLIALIIKLFKKKSEKGAKKKTEEAAKEAKNAAAKNGGDTEVKGKKHRLKFLDKIRKKKSRIKQDSFAYMFDDEVYQEAFDERGGNDLLRTLRIETNLIEAILDDLIDGYRNSMSPGQAFSRMKEHISVAGKKGRTDLKMSDIVEPVGTDVYDIDDIAEECAACANFNDHVSDISNKLKMKQDALKRIKEHPQASEGDIEKFKNMEESMVVPAITRLQQKILMTNQAIVSVMTENIGALKRIGNESDDIITDMKARSTAYEYESKIRR